MDPADGGPNPVTARITMTGMADETPRFAPEYQPAKPTSRPAERLWTRRKGAAVKRCELRDNSRIGAGFDLQIFDDN